MKIKLWMFSIIALAFSTSAFAQNSQTSTPNSPLISIEAIATELTNVQKSLQTFNKNFKSFLDKLPQGIQFSEKQQNLLLAFEILNRAEQRLAVLQKFQIDLTEKQADLKNRLAQVEMNITPEGIDRSMAFLGTTKTEEIRENRRTTLNTERNNLRQTLLQINQNMSENADEVRQAAEFVRRLRLKILPQIEREVSDLQ